jgi:hypothetical protein
MGKRRGPEGGAKGSSIERGERIVKSALTRTWGRPGRCGRGGARGALGQTRRTREDKLRWLRSTTPARGLDLRPRPGRKQATPLQEWSDLQGHVPEGEDRGRARGHGGQATSSLHPATATWTTLRWPREPDVKFEHCGHKDRENIGQLLRPQCTSALLSAWWPEADTPTRRLTWPPPLPEVIRGLKPSPGRAQGTPRTVQVEGPKTGTTRPGGGAAQTLLAAAATCSAAPGLDRHHREGQGRGKYAVGYNADWSGRPGHVLTTPIWIGASTTRSASRPCRTAPGPRTRTGAPWPTAWWAWAPTATRCRRRSRTRSPRPRRTSRTAPSTSSGARSRSRTAPTGSPRAPRCPTPTCWA